MVYAKGADSSGVTALYPILIEADTYSDFTLDVLKDGLAVNPTNVFYNNFTGGDIFNYVYAQESLFGSFSTICSTTSSPAATSVAETSSVTSSLSNSTETTSLNIVSNYVSSEPVASTERLDSLSSLPSFSFNSSGFSTSYDLESSLTTELVTFTSCEQNECTIITMITTYCPLTGSGSGRSDVVGGSLSEQGYSTSTGLAGYNLGANSSSAKVGSEIAAAIQQENNAIQNACIVPIFVVIFGTF